MLLVPLSLLAGESLPLTNWKLVFIPVVLLAGVFNTFNSLLTNFGFHRVSAILASNILLLQTVFALFISTIVYREYPNLKELIGGILIVLSAFAMNYAMRKKT